MKKDAVSLVTGQPVYTEDIASKDCLVVKALRSPHAHAWVKSVQADAAKKVPGIACIVTAETCLIRGLPLPARPIPN